MFDAVEERSAEAATGIGMLMRRAGVTGVPRGAFVGAAVLAVAAVVFVGWRLGGAVSGEEFAYAPGDPAQAESAAAPAPEDTVSGAEGPSSVWVHVAGAVKAPGLYELDSPARAGDAVARAGGPTPDALLDAVNLARVVADGEQIYVPGADELEGATGPPAAGSLPAPSAGGTSQAGVDINRASAAELESLPGVGPSTAAKIVADREANGPFAAAEDVMRVTGIGEKKFEAMREMIVVR